jgi:hypothetical protein
MFQHWIGGRTLWKCALTKAARPELLSEFLQLEVMLM